MALVALALMVVVVALATAPQHTGDAGYVNQRGASSVRGAAALTGPRWGEDAPAAPVAELSDDELCWWWRHSYTQLNNAHGVDALIRLAAQRRGYLDELERRHPARFADWISSGARAAGDPHPFIRPG